MLSSCLSSTLSASAGALRNCSSSSARRAVAAAPQISSYATLHPAPPPQASRLANNKAACNSLPVTACRSHAQAQHHSQHHSQHANGAEAGWSGLNDGLRLEDNAAAAAAAAAASTTGAMRLNMALQNLQAKEDVTGHRPLFTRDPTQHYEAAGTPGTSSSSGNGAGKALRYTRIMLKISGEALQGKQGFGVDPVVLNLVAEEIKEAHIAGLQVAVVVGGGNYFRGASAWEGLDRAQADYVGMLATCMNALLLQGALESLGVETRVQTAIEMREVAEPYIRRRAIRHLEEGRVVIFGAGTGNPFFTTDTAAALRAAEMNAEVFMKATKVDGVYDCDPMKNKNAKKFLMLSYQDVTHKQLGVMDETAVTLCKENNIPVLVFNVMERHNVVRAARGESVGTVVCADSSADRHHTDPFSP